MMTFHVRDETTDAAVRRLASLKGATLTDAIRTAVQHELATLTGQVSLADRVRDLQATFAAMKRAGGQPADKAFFDDLSGRE